jgi:hypothetical protein
MTRTDLVRMLDALSHGDSRCGFVGPDAIKVFCPACQPDGPRHADDEPHLVVAIDRGEIDLDHRQ